MHDTPWFSSSRRRKTPHLRLFCLPHAGGGTAIYHRWTALLPDSVELLAVKLPGREDRFQEAPFENLDELAQQIVHEIGHLLDVPFAIFGHSMGAAIGYRVAVHLARQQEPKPTQLFVSSCRAPGNWRNDEPLYRRNDEEMINGLLARYGKSFGDQSNSAELELMRFLVKSIRADLKMLETYEHDDAAPLDCEMLALSGTDDPQVTRGELQRWQQQTTGKFSTRIFPGHHFYLRNQEAAVVRTILDRLKISMR